MRPAALGVSRRSRRRMPCQLTVMNLPSSSEHRDIGSYGIPVQESSHRESDSIGPVPGVRRDELPIMPGGGAAVVATELPRPDSP
eukprot:764150-Hanusia_phi.AAC.5